MVRTLKASGHKNLNLREVYIINYIDINIIDAIQVASIEKENAIMRTASVIARYLAGAIFLVMELNGFLNFIPLPPPGGVAGQFMGALYVSHYLWVIFAFQVIGGLLLLVNRYVPLAVAVLAPVLVNILTFHAFDGPERASGSPLRGCSVGRDFHRRTTGLFRVVPIALAASRLTAEERNQNHGTKAHSCCYGIYG
jgi:putative oxidoreductase